MRVWQHDRCCRDRAEVFAATLLAGEELGAQDETLATGHGGPVVGSPGAVDPVATAGNAVIGWVETGGGRVAHDPVEFAALHLEIPLMASLARTGSRRPQPLQRELQKFEQKRRFSQARFFSARRLCRSFEQARRAQ